MIRKSLILYTVLLVLISIPTFISLVRPGFFTMQDDLQALRIHQMDKCFADLQIPCRWVPDMGFGYGYPQFEFYSPSIFYIGELIHLSGFQFIDSVKILFVLGFILSALSMFLLLQSFLSPWAAFVGAVMYTYAPFKATEVYVRGSISEFWALVIFPLIFWAAYKLIKTGKLQYLLYLALSLGFLLITHNLMSLIFLPLFLVWSLAWIYLEKKLKVLGKLLIGTFFGFTLAAFFLLPVIFERQYVHLDSILSGYFDYRQHFVGFYQLFFSNYFGYGSSVFGLNDDLSLSTGIVHWLGGLLAVILAFMNFKKAKNLATVTIVLATLEMTILFLMHPRSSFIWENIGLLSWLQFPWRFLADSVFILSILSGLAVYLLSLWNKKFSYILGSVAMISVIILHGNFFHPKDWINTSDEEKFSGASFEKQITTSVFDYLPIYSELPPPHRALNLPEVLKGEVNVQGYKKGSNFQEGKVEVSVPSTIRLPLYDFPGMKVYVNGKEIMHTHQNCTGEKFCEGLISFDLLPGSYFVKAQLTNTLVRTVANTLSLISFGVIIVVFIYGKNKKVL